MNLSGSGITYLLLIIPTLFALVVVGQGVYKISREEEDGKLIAGFGLILLAAIVLAYFFFIK